MFKRHGFRKNGFTFVRRVGRTGHLFNVQLSQWNSGAVGSFYLNAGVMFDEICALHGTTPPVLPKYFDCQFMVRMESLGADVLQWFSVDEDTDAQSLGLRLADAVERTFVLPLNSVACARDFVSTGWVKAVHWGLPAVLAYVLGNISEARQLIEGEAKYFADRGVTFDSLAEGYGLHFVRGEGSLRGR